MRKWKLGGWTTTPADRIAFLRTCLRLRSLRAPCGEKETHNQKWSPYYQPETKIRPRPKRTSSLSKRELPPDFIQMFDAANAAGLKHIDEIVTAADFDLYDL